MGYEADRLRMAKHVRAHCVLAFLNRVLGFARTPPAVSGGGGGLVLVDSAAAAAGAADDSDVSAALRSGAAAALDGVVDAAGLRLCAGEAAVVVSGFGSAPSQVAVLGLHWSLADSDRPRRAGVQCGVRVSVALVDGPERINTSDADGPESMGVDGLDPASKGACGSPPLLTDCAPTATTATRADVRSAMDADGSAAKGGESAGDLVGGGFAGGGRRRGVVVEKGRVMLVGVAWTHVCRAGADGLGNGDRGAGECWLPLQAKGGRVVLSELALNGGGGGRRRGEKDGEKVRVLAVRLELGCGKRSAEEETDEELSPGEGEGGIWIHEIELF